MAWSSQLRALGFVLDTVQKDEVHRAQGDFLETRAAQFDKPAAAPTPAPAPTTVRIAAPQPVSVHEQRLPEQPIYVVQVPKKSRNGTWISAAR